MTTTRAPRAARVVEAAAVALAVAACVAEPLARDSGRGDAGSPGGAGGHGGTAGTPGGGGGLDADRWPRDAALDPDGPLADGATAAEPDAAAEQCPAAPSTWFTMAGRPYDPATNDFPRVFPHTATLTATVIVSTPGSVYLQPADESWRIELLYPPAPTVEARLAPGAELTFAFAYDQPFWDEWSVVLRDDAGLIYAAANAQRRWLDEPMWAAVAGFRPSLGDRCAARVAECQDEIPTALLLAAGDTVDELWQGQTVRLSFGGLAYDVTVAANVDYTGEIRCSDQPDDWVAFTVTPAP